jgi:hypothetical protein
MYTTPSGHLGPFTKYWFRIVALGPNGQKEYSPVVERVIFPLPNT